MNSIRKKLNNNSGSSIMLALGLLLICTMISSVVVTMAATGSSRHTQERIDQQREYLSISSAAQTVMNEIANLTTYTGKEIEEDYACNDYCSGETTTIVYTIVREGNSDERNVNGWRLPFDDASLLGRAEVIDVLIPSGETMHPDKINENRERKTDFIPNGALEKMVNVGMGKLYLNNLDGNITSYTDNFTIQLSESDERIKPVKGTFTMDKDYNITLKLTMDGSNYVITISAKAKTEEATSREGMSCSHNVYYKYFDDGSFKSDTGPVSIAGIKDIRTTTVTWGEPKLTRER